MASPTRTGYELGPIACFLSTPLCCVSGALVLSSEFPEPPSLPACGPRCECFFSSTGKTLAYCIPVVQSLQAMKVKIQVRLFLQLQFPQTSVYLGASLLASPTRFAIGEEEAFHVFYPQLL